MSLSTKNNYLISLIASLVGVFFLLTEDFGAWQDRDPFYGVKEGFVWIGSENAFPWAQIGIGSLVICSLYLAYASYRGYSGGESRAQNLRLGYLFSRIMVTLTIFFGIAFVLLVWDSNWWWFDTGFYAALISGSVNLYIYRQLTK